MAVLASGLSGRRRHSLNRCRSRAKSCTYFPSVIVIKNEQGQALVLQLTPRTQVSGLLKPGATIDANTSLWRIVRTAETNTALIP